MDSRNKRSIAAAAIAQAGETARSAAGAVDLAPAIFEIKVKAETTAGVTAPRLAATPITAINNSRSSSKINSNNSYSSNSSRSCRRQADCTGLQGIADPRQKQYVPHIHPLLPLTD